MGEAFGGVDLLVNAAGVFFPTPTGATPPADASRLIDINVTGVWNIVSAAVPAMVERGGGRIVNISSVAATVGVAGFSLYCASKAAVTMLTRALAAEHAPQCIAINAVAPGNTATPMNASVRADAAMSDGMRQITPSGNAFSYRTTSPASCSSCSPTRPGQARPRQHLAGGRRHFGGDRQMAMMAPVPAAMPGMWRRCSQPATSSHSSIAS